MNFKNVPGIYEAVLRKAFQINLRQNQNDLVQLFRAKKRALENSFVVVTVTLNTVSVCYSQAYSYLELCQASLIELFCKNKLIVCNCS